MKSSPRGKKRARTGSSPGHGHAVPIICDGRTAEVEDDFEGVPSALCPGGQVHKSSSGWSWCKYVVLLVTIFIFTAMFFLPKTTHWSRDPLTEYHDMY